MIPFEDEKVRYHDSDHRSKYGSYKIQKVCKVVHREYYSSCCSYSGCSYRDLTSVYLLRKQFTGNTG